VTYQAKPNADKDHVKKAHVTVTIHIFRHTFNIYSMSTKKPPPKYAGVVLEILGKHH